MNEYIKNIKRAYRKNKVIINVLGLILVIIAGLNIVANTATPNSLRVSSQEQIIKDNPKTVFLDRTKNGVTIFYNKDNKTMKGIFPNGVLYLPNKKDLISELDKNHISHKWIQHNDSKAIPIFAGIALILIITVIAYVLYMQIKMMRGMASGKKPYQVLQPKDILTTRSDLVGLDYVNEEVDLIVEQYKVRAEMMKRLPGETKQEYKKRINGLSHFLNKPFNIKLDGPAGTGKTEQAGIIAKTLGLPLIVASAANLESGIVGGGSNMLQEIVDQALKFDKVVVFLDEAQTLFKKRGQSKGDFADDTANTFLSILEGVNSRKETEIIWVVASNFNQEQMEQDEAMLRRFPIKIDFRLPNFEERIKIFKLYLKRAKKNIGNIDYNYIGQISANLSPAIIKNIVERTIILSYTKNEEINTESLFKSFEVLTIGKVNREQTKNMQKTREIIAIHELGHFFTYLASISYSKFGHLPKSEKQIKEIFKELKTLKISTEAISRSNALGYVLNKADDEMLASKADIERRIVSLYGGQAAEEIFFGKNGVTMGSENDIQKATYMLKALTRNVLLYTDYKINTEICENKAIQSRNEIVELEKSKELYQVSLNLITETKSLIEYFRPILLEEYVLDISRIEEILINILIKN